MRKHAILSSIIVTLFVSIVSINLFLILKSDSKVERLTFLSSWEGVKQEDVVKTLQASGVVAPLEEYPIYFHDKNTTFQSFLIKQGDEVSEGTPLLTYTVDHVETEKKRLEAEKAKLTAKVTSIEDYIDNLAYSKTTIETAVDLENDNQISENNDFLNFSIDQEIYAKELEIRFLQSEIRSLDDKLRELGLLLREQTLNSNYTGIVKEINDDLTNPIMTIQSLTPVVQGILTEKDVEKVASGMKTYISFPSHKGLYEGKVTQVQTFPLEDATIDQPSEYPFTISFLDEENEEKFPEVPIGVHTTVRVVLEEVNNALIVPTSSIVKEKNAQFIYVLTNKGTIKKQTIETGLTVNGRQVVLQGVKKEDLFVTDPTKVNGNNNRFFTPIKTAYLKKQTFNDLRKKQMLKYVLYGFLH